MADYYSVLARAVLNLETADNPAARKELYERARRFVVAEFRKQNPQISAQAIRREQAALEAAVRRIEAEIPQTTAKEQTGRQGSPDSEVAEVDLRDMPKEFAAMLFGTALLAMATRAGEHTRQRVRPCDASQSPEQGHGDRRNTCANCLESCAAP